MAFGLLWDHQDQVYYYFITITISMILLLLSFLLLGKTTLLSTLAQRIDTHKMKLEGKITMNGKQYGKHELKSMSGYVMQDDLLYAHFTVLQTLNYAAELRMPISTTIIERKQRVEEVIFLLGIDHCKNVIVGDTRTKGISGGERKRLAIGIELLTRPQLLFLDEPTSGLDSTTALSVIEILKDIARKGECTVVCTIHQPSSKIFSLFDNLLLMKKGQIMYQGNSSSATDYFASLGHPCPLNFNPADHLIDVLSEGNNASFDSVKVAERFRISADYGGTGGHLNLKEIQPWLRQFIILLRRNLHAHIVRWDIILVNVVVTLIIATFVGKSVWEDIGEHKAGSAKRQAALFFCVIHQGIVASLQGSHSFPLERALMLRERAAGTYYVSAYFLSKTVADMVVQIIAPILFTCTAYPLVGFQNTGSKFMIFMAFMILDSFAATSLTNMISCLFVSIEMSTVVAAMAYEIVRLYGGWFISPLLMSTYPDWKFADAVSYIKYAFVGVSLNENDGLVLTCLPTELVSGKCAMPPLTGPTFDGNAYNKFYGYNQYTINYCFGILVAFIVIARIIAYIALRTIKV